MTRIALIDGPLPTAFPGLEMQGYICTPHPDIARSPAAQHALSMARAIMQAGSVQIDNYVVFPGRLATSVDVICDAIAQAADSDAQIIHCSFGLPNPSLQLAEAVTLAQSRGKRIVASAAARGARVFPAGFAGVISVQGDARCGAQDWSWLDLPHAIFGACPSGSDPQIGGASVAAAHFTGHLAQALMREEANLMKSRARFQGRERKTGDDIGTERSGSEEPQDPS
jgi:hypothetical protein